jgi:hypothetical protein
MYGVSPNLSCEVLDLRFRSMINAPAAKSTPPKQNAPIIIPILAPLDKPCFGQSDVTASAIPVAPTDAVAVILVVAVTVVVGVLDVVRGTLVVVSSIEGKPYSEHAADT